MAAHLHRVLLVWRVRPEGHRYYLEASPADGRGPEAPGRWIGGGMQVVQAMQATQATQATQAMGQVESEPLARLLDGADPRTGAPLGADRRRVTVAAYDLTFCAPKSVSLLHALGDPEVSEVVGRGHQRAVEEAMRYVENRALAVRRVVPDVGRVPEPAETAPAASFVHRTSRALDPHLHSHVVVANVGRGPDGRWSALDGRGVFAHRAAAGALYHAQLRHELTAALGVAWGPLHHGRAEVSGVGEEARAEFSQRSAAIAAHLAGRGLTAPADGVANGLTPGPAGRAASAPSRRALVTAAAVTRAPRDLGVSADDLRSWWRERARSVGLGPSRLEAVLDRVPGRQRTAHYAPACSSPGRAHPSDPTHEAEERRAVASALAGAIAPPATFARRHVVHAWAASLPHGEEVDVIEDRVDRFMGSIGDAPAGRPGRDRPGVAERRQTLDEQILELVDPKSLPGFDRQRQRLEQLLEARGMTPGRPLAIEHAGPELGLW